MLLNKTLAATLKPHATWRGLPGSACEPQALAAGGGGLSGAVPCMKTASRGAAAPAVCGRWGSHEQAVPCRRKGKQANAPCIAGGECTGRQHATIFLCCGVCAPQQDQEEGRTAPTLPSAA